MQTAGISVLNIDSAFLWFPNRVGMMVGLFNDGSVAWSEGVRRSKKEAFSIHD